MEKIFAIVEWEDSSEPAVDVNSKLEPIPVLRVFRMSS